MCLLNGGNDFAVAMYGFMTGLHLFLKSRASFVDLPLKVLLHTRVENLKKGQIGQAWHFSQGGFLRSAIG